MSIWEPLSIRTGRQRKFEMVEGFPKYLQSQVRDNTLAALNSVESLVRAIAVKLRVEITSDQSHADLHLWSKMCEDEMLALDVYDIMTDINKRVGFDDLASELRDLEFYFGMAGSTWRFNLDDGRLEHRVPESALETFQVASNPNDQISEYLSRSWAHAFGRDQDPEQAWHESTRAIEEALKPLVVPQSSKSTLGAIRDAIEAKPTKWDVSMPGESAESRVSSFLNLLKQLPFAPKRHGGDQKESPSIDVSRSVVFLSTSLIAIVREGGFWRVDG